MKNYIKKIIKEEFQKLFEKENKDEIIIAFNNSMKGLAKIFHVPYGNYNSVTINNPWFIFLIFDKKHQNNLLRKINNFANKYNFHITESFKEDIIDDGNPNNLKLYLRIQDYVKYNENSKKYIDPTSMILFVQPNEELIDTMGKNFYHVTFNPNVEKDGIKTNSTIKYKNRIYLWDNIDISRHFAKYSFHNKKNYWIYQVDVTDIDVYKDHEENYNAFYIKQNISPDRLKLIDSNAQENITELINEKVTKTKVICDNCSWSWNIKDGGKDLYVCHKCGYDNNPNIINEKCWKGYTQKGMKTMFGKRYPNCVKKLKEELEDYKGEHTAPSKDQGYSPMYDLYNAYGDDIYTSNAVRYYGDGYPFDNLAIAIMQSARNKPNKLIKIYRAVPDFNYQINKKIKELLKINQYYDKFNFLPINNHIIDNLKDKYPIDKYSYNEQTRLVLSDIFNQVNELKTKLQNNKLTINNGDWVTTTLQYAKGHGQAHLNNKYKIITKTVPASTLYTDGNSIHEFGYNP